MDIHLYACLYACFYHTFVCVSVCVFLSYICMRVFFHTFVCMFLLFLSLQSDTGRFECSVSALRWVCKEPVSLQYRFCSWEEHRDKSACTDYVPAGPLLDISVAAGQLEEVYLPHWIGEWTYWTKVTIFVKWKSGTFQWGGEKSAKKKKTLPKINI